VNEARFKLKRRCSSPGADW